MTDNIAGKYHYEYCLDIRGARDVHMSFGSLDELRNEVKRYFTKREQHVVKYLTTFPDKNWTEHKYISGSGKYWDQKRDWRNYTTSATCWEV